MGRQRVEPGDRIKAYTDAITRQGIQFAMNGWHSSVAMAVSELTSTYKIVHVGDLGETQFLAEKMAKDPAKYKGWFKGWPSPPVLAGLYGRRSSSSSAPAPGSPPT